MKRNSQTCCDRWVINRVDWCHNAGAGALMFIFVVAVFILAMVLFVRTRFHNTQSVYEGASQSGVYIGAVPANHVLRGTSVLHLKLPGILVDYVGGLYSIDCGTGGRPHSVTFDPNGMNTSWNNLGTQRTMTCNGTLGMGITFRVLDINLIRIVGSTGVAFS